MSRNNSTTKNHEPKLDNKIIGEKEYFTMIPNLIDDLPLTLPAFRLYFHLRRVAGEDGKCWQNTKTLAKHCFMSTGAVSKAKKELEDFGLINIEKKKHPEGGLDYDEITIRNIWGWNMGFYNSGDLNKAEWLNAVKSTDRRDLRAGWLAFRKNCEHQESQVHNVNDQVH